MACARHEWSKLSSRKIRLFVRTLSQRMRIQIGYQPMMSTRLRVLRTLAYNIGMVLCDLNSTQCQEMARALSPNLQSKQPTRTHHRPSTCRFHKVYRRVLTIFVCITVAETSSVNTTVL